MTNKIEMMLVNEDGGDFDAVISLAPDSGGIEVRLNEDEGTYFTPENARDFATALIQFAEQF